MKLHNVQENEHCDAKQAALILEVSPDTVRRWSRNGKLTHVRLPSGRVRYRKSDILALLEPVDPMASEEGESVDDDADEVDALAAEFDVPFPGLVGV